MRRQFFLENAMRLNEQAFIDRLMRAQSWRHPRDAER
jgi:hypothetical protein